jgi:hypothetical protein
VDYGQADRQPSRRAEQFAPSSHARARAGVRLRPCTALLLPPTMHLAKQAQSPIDLHYTAHRASADLLIPAVPNSELVGHGGPPERYDFNLVERFKRPPPGEPSARAAFFSAAGIQASMREADKRPSDSARLSSAYQRWYATWLNKCACFRTRLISRRCICTGGLFCTWLSFLQKTAFERTSSKLTPTGFHGDHEQAYLHTCVCSSASPTAASAQ